MLAALGEVVFHVHDLANLWDISDKNTLHTTLKRYSQQGLIHRIFRGLYAIKQIDRVDPFLLGVRAAGEFSYVSTETVLANEGIILQNIQQVTLVAAKSKKFSIVGSDFKVRQLADMFLFNPVGIVERNGMRIATVERAVADLLYFNPKAYFDASQLIDWKKIQIIQKEIGYPLTKKI